MGALRAGAIGVDFLPVKGILGSAYPELNPNLKVVPEPFSGEEQVVVRALRPDVTLVHGAKGDSQGNLLVPRRSDVHLAVKAGRQVIATVEEKVEGELRDEADWRLIPPIYITALVHAPGGAAPTGFPPYYEQDGEHIAAYLKTGKDEAGYKEYLEKHVFGEGG